jgi:LysR family transcriptional regulator, nitrogen assimilation regulatory protein
MLTASKATRMDLRQIQYFAALYEERNITKAAHRLNVVPPALSMQISRLEKNFKTQLFERTSRGVIPTDVGRAFYGLCQKILGDVHEARRYLQEASGRVTGDITVGLMPSVATSVLPGVLAEFKANYPDVTLRILEAYSGSLMDWLSSAKLDFAIVNNMGNFSGVAIMPVARDHLVLVTRWSRGARVVSEIAGHKLSDYKLVLPSQRQGMRVLIDSVLAPLGITLKPEIELDALGPTIELVRESDWATILPVVAVKRAVDNKLVRSQKIVQPAMPRELVVAYNSHRPPVLAAQLFIKVLKTHLALLLT